MSNGNEFKAEDERREDVAGVETFPNVYSAAPRNIGQGILFCAEKFHTIRGRATRLEFFSLQIVNVAILFVNAIGNGIHNYVALHRDGVVTWRFLIAGLACYIACVCVPNVCVTVRRLHDLNVSGHAAWLSLIPGVNFIFWLFLILKKGSDGSNRFGAAPVPIDKED